MEIKREGTNKTKQEWERERESTLRDKSRKNERGGEKDAKVWVVKKNKKKNGDDRESGADGNYERLRGRKVGTPSGEEKER